MSRRHGPFLDVIRNEKVVCIANGSQPDGITINRECGFVDYVPESLLRRPAPATLEHLAGRFEVAAEPL